MNWILRHPGFVLACSVALLCAGALGCGLYWSIRPRRLSPRAEAELPAAGFEHAPFAALLARFVDGEGRVDYAAWAADPAASRALESYLANLAAASPRSAPERFEEEGAPLAYWLNAYNACVIAGVLRHWPLRSVQDVRAPLELAAGLGFFGTLQFNLGGEWFSLHHLEQGLIRVEFSDPRIHFLLNCASGGCPRIRPELPSGPDLEARLEVAAREFVNDPRQVQVDHEAQRLRLSAIFVWYESDFLAELTRRGLPPAKRTLARYLRDLAAPALRAELERAADYRVEALPYDWDLNGQP